MQGWANSSDNEARSESTRGSGCGGFEGIIFIEDGESDGDEEEENNLGVRDGEGRELYEIGVDKRAIEIEDVSD